MKLPEDVRIWIGGGIAAVLVVLAAGYFLVFDPQLKKAEDQHTQTAAAIVQNAALTSHLGKLAEQSRQLGDYQAELRRVLVQLPITNGITNYAYQLATQAAAAHVSVSNLAIGGITESSISTAAAAAAAAATTTGTTDTSTPAPTATATTADTTVAPVVAVPTSAAGQVFQISFTVTTVGSLTEQQAFLAGVQDIGPRVALVNSIELAPGAGAEAGTIDAGAAMTTALEVFVAPQTAAATVALEKQLTLRAPR